MQIYKKKTTIKCLSTWQTAETFACSCSLQQPPETWGIWWLHFCWCQIRNWCASQGSHKLPAKKSEHTKQLATGTSKYNLSLFRHANRSLQFPYLATPLQKMLFSALHCVYERSINFGHVTHFIWKRQKLLRERHNVVAWQQNLIWTKPKCTRCFIHGVARFVTRYKITSKNAAKCCKQILA